MDKTTYMIGLTCPTKMIYHLEGRPTNTESDPFTDELGEMGNRVHAIARTMFPHGRWAADMTLEEVLSADGTYFEVNILTNDYQARVDILDVYGNTITLREVKSSSYPSTNDKLHDITFQAAVLQDAIAALGMVYQLRYAMLVINKDHEMTAAEVERQDFVGSSLLIEHDVTDDVEKYLNYVISERTKLSDFLSNPRPPILKSVCAHCEYVVHNYNHTPGFLDCWSGQGSIGKNDLHVLDLYALSLAGGLDRDIVTEITSDPTVNGASALSIDPMDLSKAYNYRQARQIRSVRDGIELIDPKLVEALYTHMYPLHFIDFEAMTSAIPDLVGACPYEITPFQWSVHTYQFDGSIEHREWLHDGRTHPAEEFLRTLRTALGAVGTIYIWTRYEQTAVKHAANVLRRHGYEGELLQWAEDFSKKDNPRIVDLHSLCRYYYMHPDSGGSASIKDVLPPIWRENETVRATFTDYAPELNREILDPYSTLGEVNSGTAAMTAYRTLLTTREPQPELRRKMLRYCKLDTAAMVMIWMHWMGL